MGVHPTAFSDRSLQLKKKILLHKQVNNSHLIKSYREQNKRKWQRNEWQWSQTVHAIIGTLDIFACLHPSSYALHINSKTCSFFLQHCIEQEGVQQMQFPQCLCSPSSVLRDVDNSWYMPISVAISWLYHSLQETTIGWCGFPTFTYIMNLLIFI